MGGDGRKEVSALFSIVSLGPIRGDEGEIHRKDNLMSITLGGGRKSETKGGEGRFRG